MNLNATEPSTVDFDAIVTQLLDLNAKHRAKLDPHQFLAPDWLEQACSVSVDPGRQTGKSTWLMKNASRHDDIIIVTNITHRNALLAMVAERFWPPRVFTVKEIKDGVEIGKYGRCFVDSASYVFQRLPKKDFYTWAFRADRQTEHTFILLG